MNQITCDKCGNEIFQGVNGPNFQAWYLDVNDTGTVCLCDDCNQDYVSTYLDPARAVEVSIKDQLDTISKPVRDAYAAGYTYLKDISTSAETAQTSKVSTALNAKIKGVAK
jgi:hypothetical protein